jgi:hypothetical protein
MTYMGGFQYGVFDSIATSHCLTNSAIATIASAACAGDPFRGLSSK